MEDQPRIGVSRCLLGDEVRFNGGHKHERYLTTVLNEYFKFVPVCPEVEIGMGTPRETVRLEGEIDSPRMVAPKSGRDWTGEMNSYAETRIQENDLSDLDGFIFEKNSPSCGVFRVKVYSGKGGAPKKGRGLFASAFTDAHPLVPVEEQGRLNDPALRENFIESVFLYHRWRVFRAGDPGQKEFVQYHTANKLTFMAHDPRGQTALGRIVADSKRSLAKRLCEYALLQSEVMKKPATRKRQVNVLDHARGFLKKELDAEDRAELSEVIESYRLGLVPLIVPITLLKHHFRRHPHEWISQQTYLNPYPAELMLRNHV